MQLAFNTQVLAKDLLEKQCGAGVILSPRDLPRHKCQEYSKIYKERGASILFDHQFYLSDFQNEKLQSFETIEFRQSISSLIAISDHDLAIFQSRLESIERDMRTDAVLAPSVIYEPGDPKRVELNQQLYSAAKAVGDACGVPTYASVVLSRAFTSVAQIDDLLSDVTSSCPDGFYFAMESNDERISAAVYPQLYAGLLLRCQGVPLLHGYAGPAGLLSPAFGATSVALAPPINSWGFSRKRFEAVTPGGLAKPVYFSGNLWGSLAYPEELVPLSEETVAYVLTATPWTESISPPWPKLEKGDSDRHLIYSLAQGIQSFMGLSPNAAIQGIHEFIRRGTVLADDVEHESKPLKFDPRSYLGEWSSSLEKLTRECEWHLQELGAD